MKLRIAAALALALSSSACVFPVTPGPVTLSHKAQVAKDPQPIKEVEVARCNRVFFIIPVIPQPKEALGDLLAEAKKVGGDTVIDFEIRNTNAGGFFPFYFQACYEARGMAAKL